MKIIFLDVETTGVEKDDRLCQLAFKLRGEDKLHESLYKPPLEISIDAMSITHITNEMVENCPPFFNSEYYHLLKKEFDDKNTIFVAHNAQFDISFMAKEGIRPHKHICTMKVAHHFDNEGKLGKHNLQYLRYFYKLEVDGMAHDAGGDVKVLEKLFEFYSKHLSIEEMIEISNRPILLKTFAFGKYKGEKFSDVIKKDRDYFRWFMREVQMDENMKYTINYYLLGNK